MQNRELNHCNISNETFDESRSNVTKYLPLATFAYNTFNSPNLANYSPYELVFGLLHKWLQYLLKLLQDFKSKRLAVVNKDRSFFQHYTGDLVYMISPLRSQLCTVSRKVKLSM